MKKIKEFLSKFKSREFPFKYNYSPPADAKKCARNHKSFDLLDRVRNINRSLIFYQFLALVLWLGNTTLNELDICKSVPLILVITTIYLLVLSSSFYTSFWILAYSGQLYDIRGKCFDVMSKVRGNEILLLNALYQKGNFKAILDYGENK